MSLTTQFLIITVAVAALFFVIGIAVGYWICNKDHEKTRAKVREMDVTELFKRRHGLD